jgi:arylsulfatase A-like enzyme
VKLDRRDFLKVMGAGLCAGTADYTMAGFRPWESGAKKPNIILCMADDQGWGDMAYMGHPDLMTPHFDQMAEESLRFDGFHSAAPVCSPTRGSVLTGRHPNRFACFRWGHTLRPQEVTIAERLKEVGYVTGHFGKWHLGPVYAGSPVNPGASGFDEWVSSPNFYDNDPILSNEGRAVPYEGESSAVTVEIALEFINKHGQGDRPFFAVIWFGSPHDPHVASDEDAQRYEGFDEEMKNFLGEITGMDRALGKLRRALRESDVYENTILWYCSDNGGLKAESTGGRGRKGSIYEGGLLVPALLEWPSKIKEPFTTDVPCNTADIFPSLLDMIGVENTSSVPLDGISLAPLIEGRMDKRPEPMGFWDYPEAGRSVPAAALMTALLQAQKEGMPYQEDAGLDLDAGDIGKQYAEDTFPGHSAWLDWPWKLHRIEEQTHEVVFELYNLVDDPLELTDLLAGEPIRAGAMTRQLETWLLSVTQSLNGKDYSSSLRVTPVSP